MRIKEELEANPALEEGQEKEEWEDEAKEVADDEGSEALDEFDFDEYLDDETPDYRLSAQNHGADIEDKTDSLLGWSDFF